LGLQAERGNDTKLYHCHAFAVSGLRLERRNETLRLRGLCCMCERGGYEIVFPGHF